MFKKIEKYLYIVSPLLVLVSLFSYYLTHKFGALSITTLVAGLLIGLLFFVRFHQEVVQKITKRKIKYGVNSAIITLVVLAIVVIVYLVTLERNKKFDMTKFKKFSLSEQTLSILTKLEGPIKAYAFYSKQQDPTAISDLLDQYHYRYRDFTYEVVDPDLNPGKVQEFGVEEYGELILEYGQKREKVKDKTEEGITNALIKLTQIGVKTVYFITGHGEKSIMDYGNEGYDRIREVIKAENYDVEEILLMREEKVPDNCAVLISAGPRTDYSEHEIKLIDEYLKRGGSVLFLLDPLEGGRVLENIASFLDRYGLVVGKDVIIDPMSRVLAGDYFMPVISNYTYNPITKNFRIASIMRYARSITVKESPGENIFLREVARSGDSSWAETNFEELRRGKAQMNEDVDLKGPVTVMAYATITIPAKTSGKEGGSTTTESSGEEEKESLLLAVGDSDFITNSMYQTQGNKDLFMNAVNFLADRGELITIRPKQQESVYLTMTAKQGRIAFFISILLIPLAVIVAGISITVQRRVKA